jgi:hypothetical protein
MVTLHLPLLQHVELPFFLCNRPPIHSNITLGQGHHVTWLSYQFYLFTPSLLLWPPKLAKWQKNLDNPHQVKADTKTVLKSYNKFTKLFVKQWRSHRSLPLLYPSSPYYFPLLQSPSPFSLRHCWHYFFLSRMAGFYGPSASLLSFSPSLTLCFLSSFLPFPTSVLRSLFSHGGGRRTCVPQHCWFGFGSWFTLSKGSST